MPSKLLVLSITLLTALTVTASDYPQYPTTIKVIESDKLPIELIKTECTKINEGDNINSCITNTMNHWSNYQRKLKENPETAIMCYESLKELDDYILVNNCIDAAATD